MLPLLFILSPIMLIFAFRLFGSIVEDLVHSGSSHPLHERRNEAVYESSEVASAQVTWVLDGDTVEVLLDGAYVRIRLSAIDCPEDDQPWGDLATAGLIKLIGGREVLLEIHGTDHYGRKLATVYVQKGSENLNVNERMVMLGHAWVMRRYYHHLPESRRKRLNSLERWAKSKRVGLWKIENPTPPWRWRKNLRKEITKREDSESHRRIIRTTSGKRIKLPLVTWGSDRPDQSS